MDEFDKLEQIILDAMAPPPDPPLKPREAAAAKEAAAIEAALCGLAILKRLVFAVEAVAHNLDRIATVQEQARA